MKLCQIYNSASHYRASIYKLLDESYDSDYVLGPSWDSIQQMDTTVLKGHVTDVKIKHFPGGWYWQYGVMSQLLKEYDVYLMTGEARCLTSWLFCILQRVFYPRKRVYLWSHGWYGKETKTEKYLKKLFYHLPNGGVFLYGNYARELMIKEGFNPQRLYVIHNSLNYNEQLMLRKEQISSDIYIQKFENKNKVVVFLGRLTRIKKLNILIDAISQLKKTGEEYNLVLIGDGEERENLQKQVMELGLDPQVWFYGACFDERKNAELIYNSDLCVAPGNVGLTAMHTMMFGCPVISHDDFAHQMPEFEAIVPDITGGFFRNSDVNSLCNSISRWFSVHANDREDVRRACYHEIDNSWTPQYQIEVFKKYLV